MSPFHLKWAEQKKNVYLVQAVAAKTPDKEREKIHKMHVYGTCTCISQKTNFKSMLIKICICFVCVCEAKTQDAHN